MPMNKGWRTRVVGVGSALPERGVTNADLARMVETSDEWIQERTGIRQRHVAGPEQTTASLAEAAGRAALAHAGLTVADVDLVLVATTTPDRTFPATATAVQAALGMTHGAAFDVQAVCSGFVYALSVADAMLRTGAYRGAVVIGAETLSRLLDWSDRSTCVLFGDGAGAVVLRPEPEDEANPTGILSCHIRSDGRQQDLLYTDGGPSLTRSTGFLHMAGREVFRHAVVNLASVAQEALETNGLTTEAVDWLVPHQANLRIIQGTARKLGLPLEKVVVTVDRHANTSAASIPLALCEAVMDGRLQPGQLVMLEAMGGGFTWGAVLLRW